MRAKQHSPFVPAEACRVGKGAGMASTQGKDSRTPCPPTASTRGAAMVGTAHVRLSLVRKAVPTPLPTLPATDCRDVRQNETARGGARFPPTQMNDPSSLLPRRSHQSENTQKLNDIMAIFMAVFQRVHASLQACKTGSHLA